jgi:hypothetical protein
MDLDPARILLFSSVTNKKEFFLCFFAYFFLKVHSHHSSKIKSLKEVAEQVEIKVFLIILSKVGSCLRYGLGKKNDAALTKS